MNKIKKEKIYEYFYYLLCYINLYIDNERNIKDIDGELIAYINKMVEVSSQNNLDEVDKRFQNLYLDLESIINTKLGFREMMIEYKDFIESFNTKE